MKKVLLIVLCLVLFGCTKNEAKIGDITITYDRIKNCEDTVHEYFNEGERRVYTVCIKDLMIKDTIWDFTGYVHNVYATFDDTMNTITSNMKNTATLEDGGTKVYKKGGLTIITCNNLNHPKDIYIGDSSLKYREDFCIREIYSFKEALEVLHNTEYIVFGTRSFNEETREDEFTKVGTLNAEKTKKVLDYLYKTTEYTGAITLPYPGNQLVFYDGSDNIRATLAYGVGVNELTVEENHFVLGNFNEEELIKILN